MSKAENSIKAACLAILEKRGWWARNNPVGLFKLPHAGQVKIGKKGEGDVLAISPIGRILWLETKVPKAGYRQDQVEFAMEMTRRGVDYLGVTDPEQLDTFLKSRPDLESRQ